MAPAPPQTSCRARGRLLFYAVFLLDGADEISGCEDERACGQADVERVERDGFGQAAEISGERRENDGPKARAFRDPPAGEEDDRHRHQDDRRAQRHREKRPLENQRIEIQRDHCDAGEDQDEDADPERKQLFTVGRVFLDAAFVDVAGEHGADPKDQARPGGDGRDNQRSDHDPAGRGVHISEDKAGERLRRGDIRVRVAHEHADHGADRPDREGEGRREEAPRAGLGDGSAREHRLKVGLAGADAESNRKALRERSGDSPAEKVEPGIERKDREPGKAVHLTKDDPPADQQGGEQQKGFRLANRA